MTKTTLSNKKPLIVYCLSNDTVVIETPRGSWGVVDCNDPRGRPHAVSTLSFLLDNRVERLEFVCLTHLHYDHYVGMGDLLERYRGKISEFWDSGDIDLVLQSKMAFSDSTWKKENKELTRIYSYVHQFTKKGSMEYKRMGENVLLFKEDGLSIRSLAPIPEITLRNSKRHFLNFNAYCALLRVEFVKASLLLAGETEEDTWRALIEKRAPLSANIVKVAHHGARRNNPKVALNKIFQQENAIAVITPLKKYNYPENQVIAEIKSQKAKIVKTTDIVKLEIFADGTYKLLGRYRA